MPVKILMPALSPTMTAGNLVQWIKQDGDKVNPGDIIAEVETDKATMEVESADEGIIKILIPAGSKNIKVNSVIAILLDEGEAEDDVKSMVEHIASDDNKLMTSKSNDEFEGLSKIKVDSDKRDNIKNLNQVQELNTVSRIFASPLAKAIALKEGVDLAKIEGTGPAGRIVKSDVIANISKAKDLYQIKLLNQQDQDESVLIPHSNMRKVIASRLVESKQTIPHFYLTAQCCVDKLLAGRGEINNEYEKYGVKLSINDLVIKAVAMALVKVPEVNASWEEAAGVRRYNTVDIAVAVAVADGLITPIIRNADKKSLAEISNEMKSLIIRARENTLKPNEFQGGGFSISNLGMYGVKQFNAIINPPQSGILAVGDIVKSPIVVNDQIIIAQIMDVSISCDHRVIDGVVGAKFLNIFKKNIENPIMMLV